MSNFKPLLSATIDPMKDPDVFSKLVFPMAMSPKIDGIRCLPREGVVLSRKLLPLPNPHFQQKFSDSNLNFVDSEGVVGEPRDSDVYNRTQSLLMAKKATHADDTHLYVFDWTDESKAHRPFMDRLEIAREAVLKANREDVIFVEHEVVNNLDEFLDYEERQLALNWEGVMGRRLDGPYKHNRSTFNEHILLKLKRFEDVECRIIGFIEQMTNTNEALTDELGHTKRSSAKEGMVPAGTLGKFVVDYQGRTEEVGCGSFNHKQRKAIWDAQEHSLGQILKVRHFPHGAKDKFRIARAVGFRDAIDL